MEHDQQGDAEQQAPQGGKAKPEAQESEFRAITSQDELDRVLAGRLARERSKYADYDALREKAKAFEALEAEKQTELRRLTEERDGFKSRASAAELSQARLDVALEKGLSKSQAKRLVGATREELEADADELLADLAKSSAPRTPRPNSAQGAPEQQPPGDWLRRGLASK